MEALSRLRDWLGCKMGKHEWKAAPLPGGRHFVKLCLHCGDHLRDDRGRPVRFFLPIPKRAARRQADRGVDRMLRTSARDDAMLRKTERELQELEGWLG